MTVTPALVAFGINPCSQTKFAFLDFDVVVFAGFDLTTGPLVGGLFCENISRSIVNEVHVIYCKLCANIKQRILWGSCFDINPHTDNTKVWPVATCCARTYIPHRSGNRGIF